MFLNANLLYVRSLSAAFPQVKTVDDVIGKTDFDFYPKELADKYRADDARVMALGERFETIEQYSEGGAVGYVYTEKTPLKDAGGKVFGLRVRFYQIPKPNQTTIPGPANEWERRNVQIVDKDTQSI
ncbi:MAG: PAS domain-containing protein, partial [bacterium]